MSGLQHQVLEDDGPASFTDNRTNFAPVEWLIPIEDNKERYRVAAYDFSGGSNRAPTEAYIRNVISIIAKYTPQGILPADPFTKLRQLDAAKTVRAQWQRFCRKAARNPWLLGKAYIHFGEAIRRMTADIDKPGNEDDLERRSLEFQRVMVQKSLEVYVRRDNARDWIRDGWEPRRSNPEDLIMYDVEEALREVFDDFGWAPLSVPALFAYKESAIASAECGWRAFVTYHSYNTGRLETVDLGDIGKVAKRGDMKDSDDMI